MKVRLDRTEDRHVWMVYADIPYPGGSATHAVFAVHEDWLRDLLGDEYLDSLIDENTWPREAELTLEIEGY